MALKANLTNGPSRMGLQHAMFPPDPSKPPSVRFDLDIGISFDVKINSVEREDGSGQKWNLEGYEVSQSPWIPIKAYFNSETRKGFITLESDLVTAKLDLFFGRFTKKSVRCNKCDTILYSGYPCAHCGNIGFKLVIGM